MRLGNKQTSMNLHLLLVSAKFVLYFHIYWQSCFGRDLSERSMSRTVKPMEEEFVPSVPWVFVLGTSWEVQDQAASLKFSSEFANPPQAVLTCKARACSLGSSVQNRVAEKGQPCWMKQLNILMFSVLCDLASKQLSCPQPLAFVHGWPSLGTGEVLTVQALQRQPDLIEA